MTDLSAGTAGPDLETAAGVPVRRRRTGVVVLAVVAVLLLAADVALGVLWLSHRSRRADLEAARVDAVVAARQEILNLDSLSAATIDRDMANVLKGATGTFKDQFTRSKDTLKAIILQQQSQSTATITSAAVVRADTSTATVLIAADRTAGGTSATPGAVAHDRWTVDLEKHGGRWLVADLQPVT